ncbi:MAG: hypothetical protein R3F59_31690 [Myxococcota bacterium]
MRLMGGELVAHGLGCVVDARTLGGRAELTGLTSPFDVRTTGGDLHLGLADALTGPSRAATTGGTVTVDVADGAAGRIEATTTGGEVRVEGAFDTRREGHRFHGSTVVAVGEGAEQGFSLSVKSVGGDVAVRRSLRGSA